MAPPNELIGLLATAVIGMRNPAHDFDAAQMLEDMIDRASYMQDHGQIEAARELELFAIEIFLALAVVAFDEEIEADFADGYRRIGAIQTPLDEFGEQFQIFRVGAIHEQRMNAERQCT